MVLRWRSEPISETELPDQLEWRLERSLNTGYRCRLELAGDADGHTYRRLTFPDGSHLFSELEYVGEVSARV